MCSEQPTSISLTEQIAHLEGIRRETRGSVVVLKKIAYLKIAQAIEEGFSLLDAKRKVYQETTRLLQREQSLYGSSQEMKSGYFEFEYSLRCLEGGIPDPLDIEISGINPSLITEDEAKSLAGDESVDIQAIIEHLKWMDKLFGPYPDRTNARIRLEVEQRLKTKKSN